MTTHWETYLKRWMDAAIIDAVTAERIRAYEVDQSNSRGLRLPILIALALGGIALGAGVLLFVAAHWEDLSRSGRFGLVLMMVAIFHLTAAFAGNRFQNLATALHGLGTVALGAGIFLAAQTFNLQEHWPGGIMLWAIGAWMGWAILRDPVQATMAALLTPAWLWSEWWVATEHVRGNPERILETGLLMLAITYLTAGTGDRRNHVRRALTAIGAISLIPCTLYMVVVSSERLWYWRQTSQLPIGLEGLGWAAAFGLPLALAVLLRKSGAWMNLVAALWVWMLGAVSVRSENVGTAPYTIHTLGPYILCGLGSVGVVAWGIKESHRERINLGVVGFALTILVFYFSNVMDKLGRSASLIGLGILLLLGGWELERLRRRLVGQVKRG